MLAKNRTTWWTIPTAALLAVALLGCASAPKLDLNDPRQRYRFDFTANGGGQEQSVNGSANVLDQRTQGMIWAPGITARWGGTGSMVAEDGESGSRLLVTMTVDPSGKSATFHAEVRTGDKLIVAHDETVAVTP